MSISEIIRYVCVTVGIATLISIPVIYIRKRYFKKYKGVYHWKYEMADVAFIFYIICLFQITAFRFGGLGWDFENMITRQTRVNGIPLIALWNWVVKERWWHLFYNVIGNCIWFIPLGTLLPALYRSYRSHVKRVVFIGLIVSVSIEILQYILCTGVTDIDDVIFNTLGTALGYLLWVIYDSIRKVVMRLLK